MRQMLTIAAILIAAVSIAMAQGTPVPLPPPPQPTENPITETKRVLGKILFWEEQLSSDNTVACGTCHEMLAGGADPRIGVHPGPDGIPLTPDDIFGSPGVVRADANGTPNDDPLFSFDVQVTSRAANTFIGAAYVSELLWDGRAASTFVDPETGTQSIADGGALESQAVLPILSDVEMAREGRTWDDVRGKLVRSLPLRDATDLPADVAAVLAATPDYPSLFAAAFGDPAINAERIAYSIASYERTLVSDKTPWDAFVGGDLNALTPSQQQGWLFFQATACQFCHTPPTFSSHRFNNIGLRPPDDDLGRQAITGLDEDRGRFKVPTLRNAGLKQTHMHNGRLSSIEEAVLWYRIDNPQRFIDNIDSILPVPVQPFDLPNVVDFITNGLTDPRVAAEMFPFDRPTMHGGLLPVLSFEDNSTLSWPPLAGVQQYNVYRGTLAALHTSGLDGLPVAGYGTCISGAGPVPNETVLIDTDVPGPGEGFFYLKSVIDSTGAERGLGATSDGDAREVLVACS